MKVLTMIDVQVCVCDYVSERQSEGGGGERERWKEQINMWAFTGNLLACNTLTFDRQLRD